MRQGPEFLSSDIVTLTVIPGDQQIVFQQKIGQLVLIHIPEHPCCLLTKQLTYPQSDFGDYVDPLTANRFVNHIV